MHFPANQTLLQDGRQIFGAEALSPAQKQVFLKAGVFFKR